MIMCVRRLIKPIIIITAVATTLLLIIILYYISNGGRSSSFIRLNAICLILSYYKLRSALSEGDQALLMPNICHQRAVFRTESSVGPCFPTHVAFLVPPSKAVELSSALWTKIWATMRRALYFRSGHQRVYP